MTNVDNNPITKPSARRYPIYLRVLKTLKNEGVEIVQSSRLAELMNIPATTIRKDLGKFGSLGISGHGYSVDRLYNVLSKELKAHYQEEIIFVGCGNRGRYVLSTFRYYCNVSCVFDENPETVKNVNIPVYNLNELQEKKPENCRIAVLCTEKNTQEIVDQLISCGIKGVISFTLEPYTVPDTLCVIHADPASFVQEMVVLLGNSGGIYV